MEPITFFVAGIPQPAGSKRAFVLKKGGVYTGRAIVTDDNAKSKPWQQQVKWEAQKTFTGTPLEGPLKLFVEFRVTRPKVHFGTGKNSAILKPGAPRYPTTKPDATKLVRGLEDALTSIIWKDDSQIVTQTVRKRYSSRPGALVTITEDIEPKEDGFIL